MVKRTLCLLLSALIYLYAFSQSVIPPGGGGGGTTNGTPTDYTKIVEVAPPSPNAASLGTYGALDIGLQTGTANIKIPIYQVDLGSIKLPVELNYTSGGLKVDAPQTSYGLNWNLMAGGVITRTVFGSADEKSIWVEPPGTTPQNNQAWGDYLWSLSHFSPQKDNQYDLFRFNFAGHSGTFILDQNRNAKKLQHSDLKIEKNFAANATWNFRITY